MKKDDEKGNSLPEILLVLAVSSMMISQVSHSWFAARSVHQLLQTAHGLSLFMMVLRQEANGHNCRHILHYQKTADRWRMVTDSDDPRACSFASVRQFTPSFSGIRVVDMTDGIGFYGEINHARNGHIILENAAGRYQVTLSVRGRIRYAALEAR